MLFISLLRVFTKNFESVGLIPPEFIQRITTFFMSLYGILLNALRNCVSDTQKLVKNSWSRLRWDFLSDINKNLNILAQTLAFTLL
jgi:hypothetical protein